MSHQAKMSDSIVNHRVIKQVVYWLFPPGLFSTMKTCGGATWKPRMLAVVPHVQVKEVLPAQWETAGYIVFACDGSRIEFSCAEAMEAFYSPRRKKPKQNSTKKAGRRSRKSAAKPKTGSKKRATRKQSTEAIEKKVNSPQMWLTLLWHVGSGLPGSWQAGPSDSSERGQLTKMLSKIPENSLITADAGFVGYDFWQAIVDGEHKFLIRVGGNVKLLKKLGYARESNGTV